MYYASRVIFNFKAMLLH